MENEFAAEVMKLHNICPGVVDLVALHIGDFLDARIFIKQGYDVGQVVNVLAKPAHGVGHNRAIGLLCVLHYGGHGPSAAENANQTERQHKDNHTRAEQPQAD